MASGDTLLQFLPQANEPPASAPAPVALVNNQMVLAFSTSTAQSAVFRGVMPQNYDGGGISAYMYYTSTATSGDVDIDVSVEAKADNEAMGSDSFDTVNSKDDTTVPGTAGLLDILVLDLANDDSVAAGEIIRIKIARDVANDNAAGPFELHLLEIREN